MSKKTRFVRVRIDYVLAFEKESDTLPAAIGSITQKGEATDLICDGLAAFAKKHKVNLEVMPHARYNISLHFPRVKKTKAA